MMLLMMLTMPTTTTTISGRADQPTTAPFPVGDRPSVLAICLEAFVVQPDGWGICGLDKPKT
jgi:hypothetical protein